MKPSKGRIVIHRGIGSNGSFEHPAIITNVWSDQCVNLTVFPDYGTPVPQTSQVLIDPASNGGFGWFWPPRAEG